MSIPAKQSIYTYASWLTKRVQEMVSDKLPDNFQKIFLAHATRVGIDNYEDFGSLVLLECLEKKAQEAELDEAELHRIMDRIRHRIIRRAHREIPVHMVRGSEKGTAMTTEETKLLIENFSQFLVSLSPLHVLIFHSLFFEDEDGEQVIDRLNISKSTLYRRLSEIKQAFREFVRSDFSS